MNCQVLQRELTTINYTIKNPDTTTRRLDNLIVFEDDNRVYLYESDSFKLIYDFNQTQGDIFSVDVKYCMVDLMWEVDSVQEIALQNELRKVQYVTVFEYDDWFPDEQLIIIEGIGIVGGQYKKNGEVVYQGYLGYLVPHYFLNCNIDEKGTTFCSFESSDLVYKPGNENCFKLESTVGTADHSLENRVLEINNLVENRLVLEVIDGRTIDRVEIIGMKGERIRVDGNETVIDVGNLVSGAYVVRVKIGNQIVSRMFVKK